jgi:uncharacterized membrane protein
MPAAAIATLVLAALLVAALAFYLIWVIVLLASISSTLGDIAGAIGTIRDRTEPLDRGLRSVNEDLTAVADALPAPEGEREPVQAGA